MNNRQHFRLRKHVIAGALSLGAAGSVAIGLAITSTPASAQIAVFDPHNYSQNILTAARTLQQVNNQIQSLQNEATMLLNQAKNLSHIDFPEMQALTQTMQQVDRLMGQAREHQLAERKAARESGVLVQGRTAASPPAASEATEAPMSTPSPAPPVSPALDHDRDPNAQGRKAQFVGALDRSGDVNPHALTAASSPYLLSAGSVISASLITGLRSDLPGLVTAQVTSRVFDSPTGRILLIPQGSRLIGSYDSVVAFGQKRALIVWQRIVLPDGSSVQIDNVPATDAAGYSGLQDKVDFHAWALLKGVALSTLLGVGSQLTVTGESDLVQALRESTQQNVSRAGDQLTSRSLGIQPTITVRPGATVRLVVQKDLILAPWRG